MLGNYLLEKNLVPDSLIKWKIKDIIRQRLRDENQGSVEKNRNQLKKICSELSTGPIAEKVKAAKSFVPKKVKIFSTFEFSIKSQKENGSTFL